STYSAGYQLLAIFVEKGVSTFLTRYQNQGFAFISRRYFKLEYINTLAAPGEAAKAEKGAGHWLLRLSLKAAIHEGANHREQLGLGNNGQFEIVYSLTNHLAGFEQLDLGYGGRAGSEHFAVAQQAANAGGLFFNLDHAIGLVDRWTQHRIGNTHYGKESGTGHYNGLVVQQRAQQRQ